MWTVDLLEKTLMLRKTEGQGRSQQRRRWLDGITNSMAVGLSKLCGKVKDRRSWHAVPMGLQRAGHDLMTEEEQEDKLCWASLHERISYPCVFSGEVAFKLLANLCWVLISFFLWVSRVLYSGHVFCQTSDLQISSLCDIFYSLYGICQRVEVS